MKTYEMLYVLENSLADEAKDELAAKFEGIVTSMGGTVLSTDKWGAKKLAYPINFKNDGYYALMTFEAQPAVVKELDRVAGLSDSVMRRMITVKA
ncbi:MAG: 30S ribosomal protein S6 [Clostridia bacterium]|nr:30S ribosomal protein S6 [Clostridia bacterium]